MKFSVLLPTRNRLDLLRYAVETVRRQDYDDWEIIISDNFSEDNVEGYVQSLGEQRIHCFRTDKFVPVTENWNNAIARATGDYVIMLGDDDCLMPGYFATIAELVQSFNNPDLIYTDAYQFAYPGVLPDFPLGYLRSPYNSYFHLHVPYLMDRKDALEVVKKSLSLRFCIHYNMQLSVLSRKLIVDLAEKGPVFQSFFPDFYATVAAFLSAKQILIYQQPVVTIGISPKSYGFFHFNKREETGKAFLYSAESLAQGQVQYALPGSWNNTGWFSAMQTVEANFGAELKELDIKVDYQHYRHIQIVYGYKNHYADKRMSQKDFAELRSQMRPDELVMYDLFLGLPFRLIALLPHRVRDSVLAFIRRLSGRKKIPSEQKASVSEFRTILDVYDRMPSYVK